MSDEEEYTRVDAKLMIGARKLSLEKAKVSQSRIGGSIAQSTTPTPPPVDDPALQGWLDLINGKLDKLLAAAHLAHSATDSPEQKLRPVNLSAAGAIFPADGTYERGDVIEIFMSLPAKPPLDLVMLAKVIKFSEPIVTATFARVSEDLRQKLCDYVFLREREIMMAERL
jgi:hypothetical protein